MNTDVDSFIVQVSDMKQLNEQSIKSYLDFMVKLQKYSHKPVIALKVPIALGLVLIAKGIHGFSLGLASIDYFNEEYIKDDSESFNMYSKYYYSKLISFLTYPKKDLYAFKSVYDYFGGCDCQWCEGKDAIEIGSGEKGVQLHFWEQMKIEVNLLNSKIDKELYIKQRIDIAIKEFNNIPKEILKSQKSNDYYKLLVNLRKIL